MKTRRSAPFALALGLALLPAMAAADSTERISVSSTEAQANLASDAPSISADGRFIAFSSRATNLVPGDTNSASDVFVRDRLSGTTRRVSVSTAGIQGNGDSDEPAISGNGRYVTFTSRASNLTAGANRPFSDIFVHDRVTGVTEKVNHGPYVEVCPPAEPWCDTDRAEWTPTINFDGTRIAFILLSDGSHRREKLLLRDRASGVTTVISPGVENVAPSISADGRRLAWECQWMANTWQRNLCTASLPDPGALATAQISVVKTGRSGALDFYGVPQFYRDPTLSDDGRFVAYWYDDQYQTLTGTVFLYDGVQKSTRRVSPSGAPYGLAFRPSISGDGRFVAYGMQVGSATGVFVWDRLTGATERLDERLDGISPGSAISDYPSISADGRLVAFASNAATLVDGDTNRQYDIFLRDRASRDDVLVDFGAHGVWQWMNDRRWIQVQTGSPSAIAVGDLGASFRDEALGAFPSGLFVRYGNAPPWTKVLNAVPARVAACDFDGDGAADIAADLGKFGLWIRLGSGGGWVKRRPESSLGLVCGDLDGNGRSDLVANFGAGGLWALYNDATWTRIQTGSPRHMVAGDLDGNGKDELVADFGSVGVFIRYNDQAPWRKLRNDPTEGLAVANLDGDGRQDLVMALGPRGLWSLNNNAGPLVRLHAASPTEMIAADLDDSGTDELLAALPGGLWARYDNAGPWRLLRAWPVQDLAAGGFD